MRRLFLSIIFILLQMTYVIHRNTYTFRTFVLL